MFYRTFYSFHRIENAKRKTVFNGRITFIGANIFKF